MANTLDISCQGIERLENLPDSLESLDCDNNEITRIENLPTSLREFICHLNKITRLENLPNSLRVLECSFNRIERLENLPDSLHQLYCDGTHISRLENLPKSLHTLQFCDNEITKLENLPLGLEVFFIGQKDEMEEISHIDELDFNRFRNLEIDFFKVYNIIRRFQKRWRLARKWKRAKAARTIQKGMENWLWSPKCKDGTVGISVRLALARCHLSTVE